MEQKQISIPWSLPFSTPATAATPGWSIFFLP
jgi:hypothetical protein